MNYSDKDHSLHHPLLAPYYGWEVEQVEQVASYGERPSNDDSGPVMGEVEVQLLVLSVVMAEEHKGQSHQQYYHPYLAPLNVILEHPYVSLQAQCLCHNHLRSQSLLQFYPLVWTASEEEELV